MVKHEEIFDENVSIQRTTHKNTDYLDQNKMDH